MSATDDGALAPLVPFAYDPWRDDALCAETDPELFFPDKGGSTREAKSICAACEVRQDCLTYALDYERGRGMWGRIGIWGGMSPSERQRHDADRPPVCQECSTEFDPGPRRSKYCSTECAEVAAFRSRQASNARRYQQRKAVS